VEKKGKQNIYKLTEKGAYLAAALDDFLKKCDAMEQEAKAVQNKAGQEALQAAASPAQPATAEEIKEEKRSESEKK